MAKSAAEKKKEKSSNEMSKVEEAVALFCPIAISVASYGGSSTPVLSKRSSRKLKKSPQKKSPLGTLADDEDEVPVAEVDFNANEVLPVNVFGAENFSTPTSSPERIVGNGNADSGATVASKWEIGQRVRVDQRGEGTLLFIGTMPSQPKKYDGEIWYGVALDDPNGKNDGTHSGKRYFYCLESYGTIVRAVSLEMADMSKYDIVMKALLKREEVSDSEVSSLRRGDLELFLARRKLCPAKPNQNKGDLVASVLELIASEGKKTVHEVPLKDEDIQGEQSECDHSRNLADVQAIDAACAEQSPAKRDQRDVSVDDTAVRAIDAVCAKQLSDERDHSDVLTSAAANIALMQEEWKNELSELRTASLSQAQDRVPIPVQAAQDGAVSGSCAQPVVLPSPCLPVVGNALSLVSLSVGSSKFYLQPSDADGVKEYVEKFGVMLANWSAESEGLIKGFRQLSGNVDTHNRILTCFGKAFCQAALKISGDFNGVEAVPASAGAPVAPVVQVGRPCESAPIDTAPVKPLVSAPKVAVPVDSTHGANLANIVVTVPTASPKGDKRKQRRVAVKKLKDTAVVNVVAMNKTNGVPPVAPHMKVAPASASSVAPKVKAALASQRSVLPGCEAMEGTVAFLSSDGEHGFIRHLGPGSDFFFWTSAVKTSVGVGDKVEFQFDTKAVKDSNYRRKALFVTVTHVRDLRHEINTRDARNDINAANAVRGGCGQEAQHDLCNGIKPKSASVASAPLSTGGQKKFQWNQRSPPKPQPAVVAIAPFAIVAEAMSDTIDDKVLERLAVLVLKYMSERAPPPLPPPPATCN